MWWNDLSIPKLQRCNRWSLGMDKSFHHTLNWARDYLSMLGSKTNHVSKRGHNSFRDTHFGPWTSPCIQPLSKCLIQTVAQNEEQCFNMPKSDTMKTDLGDGSEPPGIHIHLWNVSEHMIYVRTSGFHVLHDQGWADQLTTSSEIHNLSMITNNAKGWFK